MNEKYETIERMGNFWHDLPKPFFILAPMEAVTDVVFRHVINTAGRPDIFFTEFTNTDSYVSPKGVASTRGRLAFTDDEQPIVAQIWGKNPDHFRQMAIGMREMGFKGIDINMGCPDKSVVRGGAGSGLIRTPELAAEIIAATKEAGLPVSVKTRLGDVRPDEWTEWLTHILKQDIVNLTIHLRTRKEMSKVPAHYELIPAIKKLRDEVAPQTFLTINGDIRDRAHGLELVEKYGVDGIMIGRGVFTNPFAFAVSAPPADESTSFSFRGRSMGDETSAHGARLALAGTSPSRKDVSSSGSTSSNLPVNSDNTNKRVTRDGATPPSRVITSEGGVDRATGPASSDLRGNSERIGDDGSGQKKERLLDLLRYHLDLFDKYSVELEPRKFEPLKRFFKIYIRDFPGASELREKLMHTKSTSEVRALLDA